MEHEDFVEHYGSAPVQVLHLGETFVDVSLFNDFLITVSSRFTTDSYDLLGNNCNNFTEECAHFLLGTGIPSHILEAPRQVKRSCLGRCVLGWLSLTLASRLVILLLFQWILTFGGLGTLAALSDKSSCPVRLGHSSAVSFSFTTLLLDGLYTSWWLTTLASARCNLVCCIPLPALEVIFAVILAFLGYSSAISISTLHVSLELFFPGDCGSEDLNYRLLSIAVAVSWISLIAGLASRLCICAGSVVKGFLAVPGKTSGSSITGLNPVQDVEAGEALEMDSEIELLGNAEVTKSA